MENNKSNILASLMKLRVNKKPINIKNNLLKNKSDQMMFINNYKNTKNKTYFNNYSNKIINSNADISNIVKRINSKSKRNNNLNNNNKDNNINNKFISEISEEKITNVYINKNKHKTINSSLPLLNIDNFNDEDLNILTQRENYKKKSKTIFNQPYDYNSFYKNSQNNFFHPNKFLLTDSHSMKNFNDKNINLNHESLYKIESYIPKDELISNNMTINIDNIQNNFFENKNSKLYDNYISNNKNYNSYNEKLFQKYKYNLTREFIKYLNKYIYLFLKRDKYIFFNNLKQISISYTNRNVFSKGYYKNLIRKKIYNNFNNNSIKKNSIKNRKTIDNIITNYDLNYSSSKTNEYNFRHTYNNFLDLCRNHYNMRKAKGLLLNSNNNKSNKNGNIYNNNTYINSLNNNSFLYINLNNSGKNFFKKRSNSSNMQSISDEENSKKLSISISSKDNDFINYNKTLNNSIYNNKNFGNNTNRLTMKLKDNKINNNFINQNNNKNDYYIKEYSTYNNKYNNQTYNSIYVRKNSFMRNQNNKNILNFSNKDCPKFIFKKGINSENLNSSKGININMDKRNYSYRKQNNKISFSYSSKKGFNNNNNLKNLYLNKNIYNELFIVNKEKIITRDNKVHIFIRTIEFPIINFPKNNIFRKKVYNIRVPNISLKIVNNRFSFVENKNIEIKNKFKNNLINVNKNRNKVYQHLKNKSFSQRYNSFLSKKEKLKNQNDLLTNSQSSNILKNQKIIVNKKNINNTNNTNTNNNTNNNKISINQLKLNDYKNVIINCQNNKYLKGCINFLIKSISKVVYKIFIYLKFYSKYNQLKNTINKINEKKIKEYYLKLYMKKIEIQFDSNKSIVNNEKNENNIKYNNKINKSNKNNMKIIFNNKTNRYELISNNK